MAGGHAAADLQDCGGAETSLALAWVADELRDLPGRPAAAQGPVQLRVARGRGRAPSQGGQRLPSQRRHPEALGVEPELA